MIHWKPLLILVAIAGSSTFAWAVLDRRVTMMAAVSGGVWSIVAFAGASVRYYPGNSTTPVTVETPYLQYVAVFFAAISIFALYSFKRDWIPHPRHHRRADNTEQ